MITFKTNGIHFHFRAAGVAIVENHVLLQRAEGDDFCCLPGGRVNALERAEDALRRELMEMDTLVQLPVYPRFLQRSLTELPFEPQHIVNDG